MNGVLAAGGGTNLTSISISVGIVLIVVGGISIVVASYYRLLRHRADAVSGRARHPGPGPDLLAGSGDLA
jgi:hypothetical protein